MVISYNTFSKEDVEIFMASAMQNAVSVLRKQGIITDEEQAREFLDTHAPVLLSSRSFLASLREKLFGPKPPEENKTAFTVRVVRVRDKNDLPASFTT